MKYHVHGHGPGFTFTITVEAETDWGASDLALSAFEEGAEQVEIDEVEIADA